VITGIRQPHRRQADETVDNHYRQLYQIRRAHGDVISRVGLLFSATVVYIILVQVSAFNGYLSVKFTSIAGIPFYCI